METAEYFIEYIFELLLSIQKKKHYLKLEMYSAAFLKFKAFIKALFTIHIYKIGEILYKLQKNRLESKQNFLPITSPSSNASI